MNEFVESLKWVDKVIVIDVYVVCEKNIFGIIFEKFYLKLKEIGIDCEYISNFEDIVCYVVKEVKKGDIIVIIGVGDINKCLDIIFKKVVVKL